MIFRRKRLKYLKKNLICLMVGIMVSYNTMNTSHTITSASHTITSASSKVGATSTSTSSKVGSTSTPFFCYLHNVEVRNKVKEEHPDLIPISDSLICSQWMTLSEVEKQPWKVLSLLEELDLVKYHRLLIDEGYDTIDNLRNATFDELVEIGLKKPHARRILIDSIVAKEEAPLG